ncbi:transglutaminase family protein [Deinococcus detaillensis]|uniref:Transglutaminase family protein n=1 Tax=Deinococcus detaillensis TaxID=2592048 RepID=A0A553UQF0_9DEIO|nr:transglutaminase family protein [Deinococcus detaillensis]TSA82443.1 transglutaminase family protein [Deinococcus detaillensis]
MRADIRHVTEYAYKEPAWDSFNEVRLHPEASARQQLKSFHLLVDPEASSVTTHRDYFGSIVHHVHVHERHRVLRIEAQALVTTKPLTVPPPVPLSALDDLRSEVTEFLIASPRVPKGDWPEIFGVARPGPNDDLSAFLTDLTHQFFQQFSYKPGATSVRTTIQEFAKLQQGVCQDFTHAMLGVCRTLGIPARYVSGYLYSGGEMIGADATHAWPEVLIPGAGWVGFDPTNDVLAGEKHIKIGHGRDYPDVSPVRGTFYGGGQGRLDVEVRVYGEQQQ